LTHRAVYLSIVDLGGSLRIPQIESDVDDRYQEAFADMLAQFSRHLHETGYDRDVSAIKLTGGLKIK
jgi:hypothetical protein